MNFPFISFREIFHVGTLNKEDKKLGSYEGAGLSVTTEPDAWMRIAHLLGDVHTLSKENHQFLDFYALSPEQKEHIKNWGLQQGYIEEGFVYRVSWFDDELDDTVYAEFETEEEAFVEAEDDKTVAKVMTVISTEKMNERVYHERATSSLALDLLTTLFAEDVLDVDGVWWEDILDVHNYSAPRGMISVRKLLEWSSEVRATH